MPSDIHTPAVRCQAHGVVKVLTISNPPVNALSASVRGELVQQIVAAQVDEECAVILILGEGKNFIGGADIREFGKPPTPPSLPEVCGAIESSSKPVIVAVQGVCLGGGLELAISAHYRLAGEAAKFGFPEVTLGLLPGSGGTQRTTRLVGAQLALNMALTGRHVGAGEALTMGLIDRIAPGPDIASVGLAYAQELIAERASPRRTREVVAGLMDVAANRQAIADARAEVQKTSRGLMSPFKIVDAVEMAISLPFEEGMAGERAAFLAAIDSPQRAGLVHAFFAEREVSKVPDARAAKPRSVDAVGVVGGGTMGAGIAVSLLDAGMQVIMIERDEPSLARGRAFVERVYDGLIRKGRMDELAKATVMARFHGETSYDALAYVDLVVEAVFEDMDVKTQVFAELDRVCRSGCVLATNTSYLDVNAIAASIKRPQDVLGLHFFSPANVMKLLEIVVPAQASADVIATGFELAKKLKKVAVRAGVCDGFIGNRILASYRLAIDYMMEDGASPYQIDRALRDFGYPMGPLQVSDLAGGDIGWASRKRKASTRDARQRYVHIADQLCERGWFGQKSGRGWYLYPQGSRAGVPDPEVAVIVDQARAIAGVTPRVFSDDEIVRRVIAAMVNEGCRVLEEKIALRPLDIDVVFLHGYGFPRHRGGPMKYADTVGLDRILGDVLEFALEDAFFWRPAPLLRQLANEASFDSLNRSTSLSSV